MYPLLVPKGGSYHLLIPFSPISKNKNKWQLWQCTMYSIASSPKNELNHDRILEKLHVFTLIYITSTTHGIVKTTHVNVPHDLVIQWFLLIFNFIKLNTKIRSQFSLVLTVNVLTPWQSVQDWWFTWYVLSYHLERIH